MRIVGRKQIHMISTEQMVEEAIEFLKKYEPVQGYLLAFSGGKDSVVIHRLAELAGVKFTAFYNHVGIDPPELVKFIREKFPEVIFLKPRDNFWKLIPKKGPPFRTSRWCCELLKENGNPEQRKKGLHIIGSRGEESARRAKLPRIEISRKNHQIQIKPIYAWTLYHVWDFIEKQDLPCCSLYDEGFDRLGCVVCPFIFNPNSPKLAMSKERWPKMFRIFETWLRRWWDSPGRTVPEGREGETFEKFLERYYRGFQ